MHHLAETGILVLEELRNAEEEGGGFVGWELLPRVEEKGNLGKENATLSRLDRRTVEQASCSTNLAGEWEGGRGSGRFVRTDLLGTLGSDRPSPAPYRRPRLSCRGS